MFNLRPQNRRRRAQKSSGWALPRIPWAALGRWSAALGALSAVPAAHPLGLEPALTTVSVAGRFERVAPLDVERGRQGKRGRQGSGER